MGRENIHIIRLYVVQSVEMYWPYPEAVTSFFLFLETPFYPSEEEEEEEEEEKGAAFWRRWGSLRL